MENIGKFQWQISHRDTQNKQQKTANRAAARPTRQWLTAFMYSHTNNQIAALNKRFLQGIRAICINFAIGKTQNILYIYKKHSYNSVLFYIFRQFYILYIYRNILSFLNCAKTLYIYNILFFVYCANILYILSIYIEIQNIAKRP